MYEIASYKGNNLLNKELKSLVPVDTETNINLKILTQKTDVIKDTITLCIFFVCVCSLSYI